jgi:hypothetical protein
MDLVRVTTAFVWFDLNFGTSRRRPPALGHVIVGGVAVQQKICRAPFSISSVKNRLLRQRCDARDFTPLPIEILARRKVTPAFEPQRDRRAGSPNAKRGHDTGPERGPSLHVQGSVWRSCGSSLTLGTQAPDDRMEGFDPLQTIRGCRCNGSNVPGSGHSRFTRSTI